MWSIDKGYYDYDYEKPEGEDEIVTVEDTAMADDELQDALAMFGWNKPKPTLEDLQKEALEDL